MKTPWQAYAIGNGVAVIARREAWHFWEVFATSDGGKYPLGSPAMLPPGGYRPATAEDFRSLGVDPGRFGFPTASAIQ